MKIILLSVLLFVGFLGGCVSTPEGVEPVSSFEVNRYTGKWYEVARLDHSFERGLSNVTAHYELQDDGTVKVINRGYSSEEQAWDEATGTARFVESEDVGYLKVSFFGPFYGAYVIFELGEQYEYAFVSGPDRDYLWFLAREPSVSPELKQRFEAQAQAYGFPVDELIYVAHDQAPQK